MGKSSHNEHDGTGGASPVARGLSWSTIGWAIYLACSWTWCIGMFLPVLLVRDFGVWGFVVFAVPNVIGAAALGWVIGNRDRVRALIERHALAMRAFSWVTILFHVVFLATLGELFGLSTAVVLGVPVAILFGWRSAQWPVSASMRLAVVVYAVSVVAFLWASGLPMRPWVDGASGTALGQGVLDAIQAGTDSSRLKALVWLAPICVFGFALCPYLDLTFLKARAEVPARQARWAFTLGFGVFFLAMILGTLWYAGLMIGSTRLTEVSTVLGVHVAAQAMFTLFVHARQCAWIDSDQGESKSPGFREIGIVVCIVIVGALITASLGGVVNTRGSVVDMTPGEVVYRYFMSFYGLLFPAYVWLCMIPTADGHSGASGATGRRKLTVLALAVTLAAPFYWLGFMVALEHWLGVGLGIVLLSRLLLRRR